MRVIVQNVLNANLSIEGKVYSSINRGFVLLVGFTYGDNEDIALKIASKIIKSRVFMDESGLTNKSLSDIDGDILSVSQFTLYGDMRKGNRPSFVNALRPEEAKKLYEYFNNSLRKLNLIVKEGIYGEDMKVSLTNDGPFTLAIDSEELFK